MVLINKIDKPLAKLTKKRKTEKTQIANMKNESNATIIDSKNIKKIIKEYNEQFYAHIFDNLNEMDQSLERHKLPKLIQNSQRKNI